MPRTKNVKAKGSSRSSKKSQQIYNQISSNCSVKVFSQDYYDILETFNRIAEKYPILKKEEEREMIAAYAHDRPKLNKLLFYHNIRIVLNLSKKYLKTAFSAADLLMNGANGLMIAAERFDIDRNIKFNTYATKWVFKYLMMCFYSKSPVTGVNQISLNSPLFNFDGDTEQIDYVNSYFGNDEISTAFTGNTIMTSVDCMQMNDRPSIKTPSKEYQEVSNTTLIHDVIDTISADSQFSDIDRDIIYNNMMENNYSISALAQKYHVPTKEINKRKSKLIENFKNLLSDKYNINGLQDIL